MESKLYVGNLSFSTTEANLQTMFAAAGTVKSVQIIKDRDTGRSKGFGFIEMGTADEAQKAITMFNGKQLDGRALTVNIARPREERSPSGSGGGQRSNSYSSGRKNDSYDRRRSS
jgi:cold-inducible RNA-binding protein